MSMGNKSELPMALRMAYLAMHRQTDAIFQSHGVTADQFVLLASLSRGDALTQRELARRMSSDPSTVRAMLVLLEKQGLILRNIHPNDSRARTVSLTRMASRSSAIFGTSANPCESAWLQRLSQTNFPSSFKCSSSSPPFCNSRGSGRKPCRKKFQPSLCGPMQSAPSIIASVQTTHRSQEKTMTIMPSHRGSDPKRRVPKLCSSSVGLVSAVSLSFAAFGLIAQGQTVGNRDATASNDKAVVQANRTFTDPEMMKPTIDEKVFTFVDVGAKIPNYTPGRQWGTQGAPFSEMQNPCQPKHRSKPIRFLRAFACPSGQKRRVRIGLRLRLQKVSVLA